MADLAVLNKESGSGAASVDQEQSLLTVTDLTVAYGDGENARAAEIHHSLMPLVDALFVTTSPIPLKYALNRIGMAVGGTRLPLVPIDPKSQAIMDAALANARVDLKVAVPA